MPPVASGGVLLRTPSEVKIRILDFATEKNFRISQCDEVGRDMGFVRDFDIG